MQVDDHDIIHCFQNLSIGCETGRKDAPTSGVKTDSFFSDILLS